MTQTIDDKVLNEITWAQAAKGIAQFLSLTIPKPPETSVEEDLETPEEILKIIKSFTK